MTSQHSAVQPTDINRRHPLSVTVRALTHTLLLLFMTGAVVSNARAGNVIEYLSDTPERILHHRQEWGELGLNTAAHQRDLPATSITIQGQRFEKGLGTHAAGTLVIALDPGCKRFEAEFGIQEGQRKGTVEFEIRLDGKQLLTSGLVREETKPVSVGLDVTGGHLLELIVTNGGDGIGEDLANWGNARLIRDNSVSAANQEEPTDADVDVAPFAVVIGTDPRRQDGVHNGRFDSFPHYELHPDWPLNAEDTGCTSTDPLEGEVTVGLRWLERRRLSHLELQLPQGAAAIAPGNVRVQRWAFEKGGVSAGGSRWQGRWLDMAGSIRADNNLLHFTPDWKNHHRDRNEGIQKIRWILKSHAAVRIEKLRAWTDTSWTTSTVHISATKDLPPGAELELYNGTIITGGERLHRMTWSGSNTLPLVVQHSSTRPWKSDATVLQFTLPGGGFGVGMDDLLVSRTINIAEYGITVSLDSPDQTAAAATTGTTILEDVRTRPDQTFQQAMVALVRPDAHLGPTMLSLACDIRKYVVQRNGSVAFDTSATVYNLIDKERKDKYSCLFEPRLGSGTGGETTRTLEDGWLPVPTLTTSRDGLVYRQRVFVAPVGGHEETSSILFAQARALAVNEFTVENPTTSPLAVQILLPCFQEVAPGPTWTPSVGTTPAPARLQENMWVYEKQNTLMCAVTPANGGELETGLRDGVVAVTGTLAPGASSRFQVFIPGWESNVGELMSLPSGNELLAATRKHWERALSEGATIKLPDAFTENLIRASQVHCMMASRNRDSAMIAPWIGSDVYGPLESESQSIIRGMEGLGHFEFARRAHDYFIARYNGEGFVSPTYTVVGTGWHLWSLGEYVRLSADLEWMKSKASEVTRVCRWIVTQLAKTSQSGGRTQPDPLKGLMPPGAIADWETFASWYSMNGWFYAGLQSAATALHQAGTPEAAGFLATNRKFGEAIRNSFATTRKQAPVVPLRNGTWTPYYPAHPECPLPVEDLHANEDSGRSWCYNVELGAHHLIPQGVLDANGPEADSMVNHMEDIQFLRDGWNCYPAKQSEQDPYNLGGFAKVQPFYARIADIHAMRDDIKPFLRTWINSAASLVNPEDLSLWEHFFNGAWNKTHETGWFLNQTALVFAREDEQGLWLAPFVSDKWLQDGMSVEARRIPTSFGRTGFRLTSHVSDGRIEAEVDFPESTLPHAVFLRVRHPEGKAVREVEVDGVRSSGWKASNQTLLLKPVAGASSRITIRY